MSAIWDTRTQTRTHITSTTHEFTFSSHTCKAILLEVRESAGGYFGIPGKEPRDALQGSERETLRLVLSYAAGEDHSLVSAVGFVSEGLQAVPSVIDIKQHLRKVARQERANK